MPGYNIQPPSTPGTPSPTGGSPPAGTGSPPALPSPPPAVSPGIETPYEVSPPGVTYPDYAFSPPSPAQSPVPAVPPGFYSNPSMAFATTEKKKKGPIQIETFTYAPNRKQLETIGIVPMQEPKGAKFYRAVGKGKIAEVTKSESDKIKIVDHNVKGETMFTMPQVRMPPRKRR